MKSGVGMRMESREGNREGNRYEDVRGRGREVRTRVVKEGMWTYEVLTMMHGRIGGVRVRGGERGGIVLSALQNEK